jgi:flavorubredoxin
MGMKQNQVEIFGDIYRLSLAPNEHFEFNQFLVIDEKVCLIHTGKKSFFEALKSMALACLKGREIDYFLFSHFEADECGSINEWLELFPKAQVFCNKVANINLGDFLSRPATVIRDGEVLELGKRKLKMIETPHFPHNWDAHMWLEENDKILFSSDFCCHGGISSPTTDRDNSQEIISFYEKGGFIPYGKSTNDNLKKLRKLEIRNIAPMHGSVIKEEHCLSVLDKVSKDLQQKSMT